MSAETDECPVCLEKFTEAPRIVVPCGHNICHPCLTRVSGQNAKWHCPSCRTVCPVSVDKLMKNRGMWELIVRDRKMNGDKDQSSKPENTDNDCAFQNEEGEGEVLLDKDHANESTESPEPTVTITISGQPYVAFNPTTPAPAPQRAPRTSQQLKKDCKKFFGSLLLALSSGFLAFFCFGFGTAALDTYNHKIKRVNIDCTGGTVFLPYWNFVAGALSAIFAFQCLLSATGACHKYSYTLQRFHKIALAIVGLGALVWIIVGAFLIFILWNQLTCYGNFELFTKIIVFLGLIPLVFMTLGGVCAIIPWLAIWRFFSCK